MMRRWSFYDLRTGEFVGREMSAPNDNDMERNTPSGYGAIEGSYDRLAQRVDLATGQVVDWVNSSVIDAVAKRDAANNALARIRELEANQARVMREDRLRPNDRDQKEDNKTPREKLQAIDDEIAVLRAVVSAGTDTSARRG